MPEFLSEFELVMQKCYQEADKVSLTRHQGDIIQPNSKEMNRHLSNQEKFSKVFLQHWSSYQNKVTILIPISTTHHKECYQGIDIFIKNQVYSISDCEDVGELDTYVKAQLLKSVKLIIHQIQQKMWQND